MIPGRIETIALLMLIAGPSVAAPLVVLDPGHGGHRAGARSAGGAAEKTIVLSVARHARETLVEGGVRVRLTRDADQHVTLAARVALANRHEAAVFVSIHTNSSPVLTRRGSETYVLSAQASDDVSSALIHLENDEDDGPRVADAALFGGGARVPGDVGFILADLKRSAAHQGSARLAKRLQALVGAVPALAPSRGLRQAPFKVLRGARMPAALVEIGYVSHTAQARALTSARNQQAAGRAIARGILAFLEEHRGVRR